MEGNVKVGSTKLLKVPQAAEELSLSPKTVWQMVADRRLAVVRLGRAVRIPTSEIERLIEEGTTPARLG
jgi:excisionase family DNA binding protein